MENGKSESPIRLSENVRETINQDGAVLLDIKQGLCFSMNPVGAKIWELLKQGCPPAAIVDNLEKEFEGVARSQLEIDVAEFVSELQSRRLVNTGREERSKKPNPIVRFLKRNWA
jgi:Coenzyme PQQ synthesis protein D (PqqD)